MSNGAGTGHGWGAPSQEVIGQPDWAALAEQHEHDQKRRKQLQIIGAAVVATLAIGGITAAAVLAGGPGMKDPAKIALDGASASPNDSPSASAPAAPADTPTGGMSASASPAATVTVTAKPKAPASSAAPAASSTGPMDPLTVISSASTDTAPLDPNTLFAATTLTINGKTWTRLVTKTDSPCWQATTGHLGDPLTAANCHEILRATYTSGYSAVTVGVAVIDTKAQADAAIAGNKGQLQGLVPSGWGSYCTSPGCANSHASIGRYAYYTVQGNTKPGGTSPDATADAAAPSLADYTREQLLARGQKHS